MERDWILLPVVRGPQEPAQRIGKCPRHHPWTQPGCSGLLLTGKHSRRRAGL